MEDTRKAPSYASVFDAILSYLDVLGVDPKGVRGTDKFTGFDLSSLDILALVQELEDEFGVRFDERHLTEIATIDEAIRHVREN